MTTVVKRQASSRFPSRTFSGPSSRPSRTSRLFAALVAATLVLLGVRPVTHAGENGGQALTLSARSVAAPEADAQPDTQPDTVDAALERGDLGSARELAKAQREADPSAANWRTEAEVLERAGDYGGAIAAYQAHMAALPDDAEQAHATAKADLARVKAQQRGTVAGEPASTHREELDAAWAPKKKKANNKPKKKVAVAPVDEPDDRVIDKWYFWVTLGAIVASAAAVTGIAIRASRQDQPDALGLQRAPTTGPTMLRF